MFHPSPSEVLAVAQAIVAERRAKAERERLIRQGDDERRPAIIAFPGRPKPEQVSDRFDQTLRTPKAA